MFTWCLVLLSPLSMRRCARVVGAAVSSNIEPCVTNDVVRILCTLGEQDLKCLWPRAPVIVHSHNDGVVVHLVRGDHPEELGRRPKVDVWADDFDAKILVEPARQWVIPERPCVSTADGGAVHVKEEGGGGSSRGDGGVSEWVEGGASR